MGKVFLHARSTSKEKADPYATLTVHCPLRSTIRAESVDTLTVLERVSNNEKVIFDRMAEGEWDITIVGVDHAPTRRVEIDSLEYEMTLKYFEAYIGVTYPAGSTCIATDGNVTLTAPDTSGKWDCAVKYAGVWTITSTYGDRTVSKQVIITEDEQTETIALKYFEAYVNVTYPAGSTCVATDGKITLTAPDTSGKWVCTIRNTGTWTITSTHGDRTVSKQVVITKDEQLETIALNYFEATLNISYPVGSTCTVYNGSTNLVAPNTNGTWACTVPHAGTWTISCIDGAKTVSEDLIVTTDGETLNVKVNYPVIAYSTKDKLLSDSPRENTIGIISDTAITGWDYTVSGPDSPISGMVWVIIGNNGVVSRVRQYVSNIWMDVPAYTYLGGEWLTLDVYIPINDTDWTRVVPYPTSGYSSGTYDFSSNSLKGRITSQYQSVAIVKRIDFSSINKITFDYSLDKNLDAGGHILAIVGNTNTSAGSSQVITNLITDSATNKSVTLDVSSVNGWYYFWLGLAAWSNFGVVNFEISNLRYV